LSLAAFYDAHYWRPSSNKCSTDVDLMSHRLRDIMLRGAAPSTIL
jgi:hypothetical protein